MTYVTHRESAIVFACAGTIILSEMKLSPVSDLENPMIETMYTFANLYVWGKSGAYFPDLDHLIKNIREKTAINLMMSNLIRWTGGVHRSRTTHSVDIFIATYMLFMFLTHKFIHSMILQKSLYMMITGFWIGWLSHLFADSLSMDGIRIFCWSDKLKIRLVPKSGKVNKSLPMIVLVFFAVISLIITQFANMMSGMMMLAIGVYATMLSVRLTKITFKTGIDFEKDNNWERIIYDIMHKLTYLGIIAVVIYALSQGFPEIKQMMNINTLKGFLK